MFSKYLFRYRLNRLLKNKKLNRRLRCLFLIQLLHGNELAKLQYTTKLNVKLALLYTDIVTYTKKIKEINYHLDRKSLISSDILSNAQYVVILDNFFTDQSNCYVDVTKSFDAFKTECIRMLSLLEESDRSEYGYFEHTLRILTNVLQNLEDVLIKIATSI